MCPRPTLFLHMWTAPDGRNLTLSAGFLWLQVCRAPCVRGRPEGQELMTVGTVLNQFWVGIMAKYPGVGQPCGMF